MKYIDLSYINEVTGGDEELFKELTDIFFKQIDELKITLKEAANNNDYDLIKHAAHKIKSTLRTFGAKTLANDFETIETYNNLELFENLNNHIDKLLNEVELTSQELKQYLKESNI
jgi:HPt (histidine-containing phosphotransfer) domain-containing protein